MQTIQTKNTQAHEQTARHRFFLCGVYPLDCRKKAPHPRLRLSVFAFVCSRPRFEGRVPTIARLGAIADYEATYQVFSAYNFTLINSPAQHYKASELEHWYPIIEEFTPKSIVFEQVPTAAEVLSHFDLPVFIKGNRQTAKHNPALAIAHTRPELENILKAYQQNSILHWQKLVCREYIPLQKLDEQAHHTVPLSFEFRTFWWKGTLVGAGNYWSQFADYTWTDAQRETALSIATIAAQRLKVPFLVIDLALTEAGNWIVIECNDGQESGYAGVDVRGMWRNILREE